MKTSNLKSILAVLALVLIGYFAGFHHHRYVVQHRLNRIAQLRTEPGSGMEQRLFDVIKATPEQEEKITPILQKRKKELHQTNLEIRERRKPILDSMRAEIEVLLTPEQIDEFDQFMKRLHRPFSRKGKKRKMRK